MSALVAESLAQSSGDAPLIDVETLTRELVLAALRDAVAHPAQAAGAGRPRTQPIGGEKAVVFMERHENGKKHFHIALKLDSKTCFLPLKLALRQRSHIASHWSTTHTMFWSACRYGTFTTPKKPMVDKKPLRYTQDGRTLNLYEESQEPFMASVVKARREQQEVQAACDGADKPERFTKLDFNALVIEEALDTPAAVREYVQDKGSAAMQTYVARISRHLVDHIKDAHEWRDAKALAAAERETDWELLLRLAGSTCGRDGGRCAWWRAAAQPQLQMNTFCYHSLIIVIFTSRRYLYITCMKKLQPLS